MNKISFERKLISVLKDNLYDRYVSRKRTGILDTKKLYRVNSTDRLFKQKQERKGKHYNITIMVDGSGSMRRGRVSPTIRVVQKLNDSFNKLNLNYQIQCFNADLFEIKSFKDKVSNGKIEEEIRRITDDCDLESKEVREGGKKVMYSPNFHKKDFSKVSSKGKYLCLAGNFDGFYLDHIVNKIKKLKGQNIVIVLSDGRPAHDYGDFYIPKTDKKYLKDYPLEKVVKSAIKSGIIFLGIGIETRSVEKYYPKNNTVVVNELDKMYSEIIGKLDKLIKRG